LTWEPETNDDIDRLKKAALLPISISISPTDHSAFPTSLLFRTGLSYKLGRSLDFRVPGHLMPAEANLTVKDDETGFEFFSMRLRLLVPARVILGQ
jgi:hypothetical protein